MNPESPSWDLYRSFLAVLRDGSLSAAARSLGLTQPTLARHVAALEEAVGGALFVRSPRGLEPTDAALALKPQAESLEATAAALWRTASGLGDAVRGPVRVTASEIVGARVLPPILTSLRARHPELVIELVLSNSLDNLLQRDADVAVRMVEPDQQALVVRKIGSIALGLHAHQEYLDRQGAPLDLADLARHSVIGFDRPSSAIRAMAQRMAQRVPGFLETPLALRTDSDLAQLAAIEAGFGVGICQIPLARRNSGLVRLLPESLELSMGVWVAMHEDLRSTPRCRAVFDGLVQGLSAYVAEVPRSGA